MQKKYTLKLHVLYINRFENYRSMHSQITTKTRLLTHA